MHPYNRLPSSGHSTPSPPASPLRSPRLRPGRSKTGRFSPGQPAGRTYCERLAWIFLSCLLRRQGIFLFAPLIYISCMLLYMGTVSFDVVPVIKHHAAPGSVYRSPELYAKLRPEMDVDNSSADAVGICRFGFFLLNYFWILMTQVLYLFEMLFLFIDFFCNNFLCSRLWIFFFSWIFDLVWKIMNLFVVMLICWLGYHYYIISSPFVWKVLRFKNRKDLTILTLFCMYIWSVLTSSQISYLYL